MFEGITRYIPEPTEEVTVYASNLPKEIRGIFNLGTAPLEFERNDVGFHREVKEDGVKGYLLILSKNKTIADVYNSDFIKEFENNPDYSFVHIIDWNENYFKP